MIDVIMHDYMSPGAALSCQLATTLAVTMSIISRARLNNEPPNSSVRLLVAGDRKPRTIEE